MQPLHRPKYLDKEHSHDAFHHHEEGPHLEGLFSLERKKLILCLGLLILTFAFELWGSFASGSLALLSDAVHVFVDLMAVGMSFFALKISERPASFEKTYGYFRAEVLVALFQGLFLGQTAIWMGYEAYEHLKDPMPIRSNLLMMVSAIGFITNLTGAILLIRSHKRHLSLKGAYLHLISDTLSSLGVLVAAVLIRLLGWVSVDAWIAFGITAVIFYWSVRLILHSVHVLMESTPKHLQIPVLVEAISQQIREVKNLHDLHVWEITSQMYAMTAHVEVVDLKVSETERITQKIHDLLSNEFHIEHINLQYELFREA